MREDIMKTIFALLSMLLLYSAPEVHAQVESRQKAIEEAEHEAAIQISDELESIYGQDYYGARHVYEIDSLIGLNRTPYFLNPLDDPYGTLNGCFVFVSGPNADMNGNMVGVYKDGHILWHSDTLKCLSNLRLFTTCDLNNEGMVDVAFEDESEDFDELWIFSWDGKTGRMINAVDSNGFSVIQGYNDRGGGAFGLIDVEGDGIWEIYPYDDEDGTHGYSWDGQQYGHWANTPNTKVIFPPRNHIDIAVNCRVIDKLDTLFFYYDIFNKAASKQSVEDMRIWCESQNVVCISSPPYWDFSSRSGRGFGWSTMIDYTTGQIRIGKSVSGFGIKAMSLCTIENFHSHGFNGVGALGTIPESLDKLKLIVKDDLENAVWGKTIVPADPPSPFIPSNFIDTLTNYTAQSRSLGWINDQATADKYSGYFSSVKASLQQNNTGAARTVLQQVLQQVNIDSTNNLTSEAYALIRYNTEYLLSQLPTTQPGFIVKLINSAGARLSTGSLQYYEGSWKYAANNNDGTFTINTTAKTLSLRMTYEYGTQTKSNMTVGTDTAVFRTVNAQIKLQDSKGNPIDTGTVQYYAGAWRNLGTTTNGVATKELLPNGYSFRMTYAYGSNDKQQDIGTNPTVVFQTVNAAVQLQDSHGNLIDQGTVQYYAGAWRDFGTTSRGIATEELLPNNYTFRMTYAYGSNDKQQDIGTNPTVVFQTVNATVQLKNSRGNVIDRGTVQYYAGAWRDFGTTVGGVAAKELLPNNYTFRMTHEFVSNDKAQNISTNSTVAFSTVLCTVRVTDSQNQPVNNVQASYYSGAWRQVGSTVNGEVTKELLPANLTFRITYGTAHQDKTQNLSANDVVEFAVQQ